jgi:hypothetical protein
MRTELDIRLAVAEANEVFRRFPLQTCLPLLIVGLSLDWALIPLHRLQDPHRVILPLITILLIGVAGYWASCAADAGTSAMYLRAREGGTPTLRQIGQTVRLLRFNSVTVGLLVRYMGWVLLWVLGGVLAYAALQGIRMATHRHVLAGNDRWLGLVVELFIVPYVAYRYTFVFQQFVIQGGMSAGFLDECVQQAKRVWKIALLVTIVDCYVFALVGGAQRLFTRRPDLSLWAEIVLVSVPTIVRYVFAAWMVLVRTGLALQLGGVGQERASGDEPMISGEPSPA